MSSESVLQVAQLSTILIGWVGLAVSLRSHRRQMHAQMFIEFSSRIHDLLQELSVETWAAIAGEVEPVPPRSAELTKSCMQCFRIIADLHHLHQAGYISPDLWKPWRSSVHRMMQGPLLRREWIALEPRFDHQPELCRFIRGLISGEGERKARSSGICPHCRQVALDPS